MATTPRLITLLLACFLGQSALKAQDGPSLSAFYQQFQEVEFEHLHVYSFDRRPAEFLETSLYPFKGQRLDSSFYPMLEKLLEPYSPYTIDDAFFATYRFHLNGQLEALLLREFKEGGEEHHIHLLLYDNQKAQITQHQTLAYSFGYEGAMGGMESCWVDLNKDGQKDLLTRKREDYYSPDGNHSSQDSMFLYFWAENAKPQQITIQDATIQASLAADFPYHQSLRLSAQSRIFLRDSLKLLPAPAATSSWYLLLDQHPNLAAATEALKQYQQQFIQPKKYSLDYSQFEVHQKQGAYHLVISGLYTENNARILQHRLQELSNLNIQAVLKEDFCPNSKYRPGRYDLPKPLMSYYDCED